MASPTHKENILKPQYSEVGFGVAQGMYDGRETSFVVEFFAAPATPAAAKAPKAPPPIATTAAARSPLREAGAILGAATASPSAIVPVAPTTGAPAPAQPGRTSLLDRTLASPWTALSTILAGLVALVAALVAAAGLRHLRIPHPQVLAGGALLLALTFGLLAFDRGIAGHIVLPIGNLQLPRFLGGNELRIGRVKVGVIR